MWEFVEKINEKRAVNSRSSPDIYLYHTSQWSLLMVKSTCWYRFVCKQKNIRTLWHWLCVIALVAELSSLFSFRSVLSRKSRRGINNNSILGRTATWGECCKCLNWSPSPKRTAWSQNWPIKGSHNELFSFEASLLTETQSFFVMWKFQMRCRWPSHEAASHQFVLKCDRFRNRLKLLKREWESF